jgi:P4 family phage/plasmid primase-like protien
MTERVLTVSLGKKDPAIITRTWRGTFTQLVEQLLKDVRNTEDKAGAGWICGAEFSPEYRHSEHFVARHLLSFDYDHIQSSDIEKVLDLCRGAAFLAYTTWSHIPDHPRLRVWLPLSRPTTYDEFQAVSRKVAARAGMELAARESHTPAQFMYRPASQKSIPFQHWEDTTSPYLDVDKVLGEYSDWKDRSQWPHRKDGDHPHDSTPAGSALEKPGIIGEFNRAFGIRSAIERFGLPYRQGSSEDRWTYTAGSRADGAVIYDDDTKLHSHHDTDPARGQHNAYDLVRLHLFGTLDGFDGEDVPISDRASSKRMVAFANEQPEITATRHTEVGFTDLDADLGADSARGPRVAEDGERAGESGDGRAAAIQAVLPPPIPQGTSKCSDLENARRIQKVYGKNIIAIGEVFYVWSGTHWVKDDAPVRRLISKLSAMVEHETEGLKVKHPTPTEEQQGWIDGRLKWSANCCSSSTLAAAEKLLRSYLDFKGEQLNAARNLLTCRTGTIDLRTGDLRAHSPGDFITACAPTEYVPAATAARFARFLREIFRGDESVVAFAKRWFGYCITGEVREHAMVFHIGEGGNGKGKLMEALQHVLGPGYAGVGARSLLGGNGKGASPELADLMGRRMVTLTETNRDEEFNEGILKEITGGDRLKARNLYEGFFEFNPTHKLQIFTNNEPRITGQDRGIWRRLFLLKYDVKYGRQHEIDAGIAQELQDDELDVKLAAEAEGILAWLVEGAREWYAEGLKPPPAVVAATLDYKARQDNVGQFLAERTIRDPEGQAPLTGGPGSLYGAYKGWATEMGYGQKGRNNFAAALLKSAPYLVEVKWQEKGRWFRGFRGLRLAQEALL